MIGDQSSIRKAQQIIEAAHLVLTRGRLADFLEFVTDDFVYESNAGPAGRGPVGLVGKAEFLHFWQPVYDIVSTRTVPQKVSLSGDVYRVQVRGTVTHRASSAELEVSYRQLINFRAAKFSHISEVHDPGTMNSFCRMVMTA